MHGYWWAAIQLQDRRRIRRRRYTREDAEAALDDLLGEYVDQLGYGYHRRKPYQLGTRAPAPRSGVTPRVRFLVFQRDGFRCVYCGATPKQSQLHVDHIVPVAKGGTDHPSNLATACVECNLGKSDLSMTEDVENV
jgi:5-methylcytosine-specific restriction endonuclease McrA